MEDRFYIPIPLGSQDELRLYVFGETNGEELMRVDDARENGEADYQIKEGCFYEYKITDTNGKIAEKYQLDFPDRSVVVKSKGNKASGRIAPNVHVGTLHIDLVNELEEKCGEFNLEVQSVKASYRSDYRQMLEEIAEKCCDLLLQHTALTTGALTVDFDKDPQTLYQRFAFVRSVIDSTDFNDAVHKIVSSPVTRWKETEFVKDIRSVRRFGSSAIRQLASASNRIGVPAQHPLRKTLETIPSRITVNNKMETVDTPENRFVLHALTSFQTLCSDFKEKAKDGTRLSVEADLLIDKLEQFRSHSIFKEVSTPTTIPLNSPVLQRKEGYREVLRSWLMMDLAARLIWKGGDDVYDANKKDVAVLYEYWLFFKLLDVVRDVFKIEPKSIENLIGQTEDGLGLQLRQGRHLPIKGIFAGGTRKLNVEFSYNRTFSPQTKYPAKGSWTRSMRPDYTLSIWPAEVTATQAEEQELIVHVHFDSKYKVDRLIDLVGDEKEFDNDKAEQRRGNYKRADLLKMHSYKDAIRRTGGAYVLYPGETGHTWQGFHEIIPGLGAFAVKPSEGDSGIDELKKFLRNVVDHFVDRTSQRERASWRTYDVYKNDPSPPLEVVLPAPFGANRSLIPDETYVLVAFYKDQEHLDWILKEGLYNVRAEGHGALRIGPEESGARFILLHSADKTITNELLEVTEIGPQFYSRKELRNAGYPSTPSKAYYLVYKVKRNVHAGLEMHKWDVAKVSPEGEATPIPFAVSLSELMRNALCRE